MHLYLHYDLNEISINKISPDVTHHKVLVGGFFISIILDKQCRYIINIRKGINATFIVNYIVVYLVTARCFGYVASFVVTSGRDVALIPVLIFYIYNVM